MTQQLNAIPENPGLVPGTHMAAHKICKQFQEIQCPMASMNTGHSRGTGKTLHTHKTKILCLLCFLPTDTAQVLNLVGTSKQGLV